MEDLKSLLDRVLDRLEEVEDENERDAARRKASARRGSRFAGPGAADDVLDVLADGGSVTDVPGRIAGKGRDYDGRDVRDRRDARDRSSRRGELGETFRKALSLGTGSAGGVLVQRDVLDEVLMPLRARSVVRRLGARTIPFTKELWVTGLSTGAAAYWVSENAPATVSEETFFESKLTDEKELVAFVPVSRRLFDADDASIDDVVRGDLVEVLALAEDLAFLRGAGGLTPLGIRNQAGLTPAPSLGANGRAPTFDDLKDMVAALRNVNAPFNKPGWAFAPRTINTLEKLKDSSGRYLQEAGLLSFDDTGGGGRLLGYPFFTTTQIPTNLTVGASSDTSEIYFSSDWQEAIIGEALDLEIALSGETTYQMPDSSWRSAFQNREIVFRAVRREDLALRRPQLFSVMVGVRPA